ncbi:MAG: hypothetical protein BAJALOKI1v1_1660004 [Promethearchaeota archaeon]|nr:MAG: hypothetical protein BAJALOKI1v1_1660004 [Candidatus Lokiarchaeota archaeon]
MAKKPANRKKGGMSYLTLRQRIRVKTEPLVHQTVCEEIHATIQWS